MSNPFDDAVFELLTGKSTSAPPQPVDGDQLLHDISTFIGRYLYCSEHQRAILALWVLHTYCYHAAQVTPYLAIQSAEKQSGKTLCLQLLQLLCNSSVLTAGFTASSLLRAMKSTGTDTLLLDECQASIGTRPRPKGPTLRAILIRGTHQDPDNASALRDRRTFCPKAFAGRGQLPEDLADHSIPIILQPLDSCVAQPPGSPARAGFGVARDGVEVPSAVSALHSNVTPPAEQNVEHLHIRYAVKEAQPLRRKLRDWHTLHSAELGEMPSCLDDQFPPDLSYRQQDLCEPLLHLAQLIGGAWPALIHEALAAVFEEQARFDLQANIHLLADVRDCFAYHGYPKRLSTADLLDWIHSLPSRPWDLDGRFSAHTLARLLAPFEIRPRMQRMDIANANANRQAKGKDNSGLRGYQLQDFQEPWKKHLDFEAPQSELADEACVAQPPGSPTHAGVACGGVELPSAVSGSQTGIGLERVRPRLCSSESAENDNVAEAPESEIASNNKGCCGVAPDATTSAPIQEDSDSQSTMNEQLSPSNYRLKPFCGRPQTNSLSQGTDPS